MISARGKHKWLIRGGREDKRGENIAQAMQCFNSGDFWWPRRLLAVGDDSSSTTEDAKAFSLKDVSSGAENFMWRMKWKKLYRFALVSGRLHQTLNCQKTNRLI